MEFRDALSKKGADAVRTGLDEIKELIGGGDLNHAVWHIRRRSQGFDCVGQSRGPGHGDVCDDGQEALAAVVETAMASEAIKRELLTPPVQAPALAPAPAAFAPTAALLNGETDVKVRVLQEISSDGAKVGDRVEYMVDADVVVDNRAILRNGAIETGTVLEVVETNFKRPGKLPFDIQFANAVNGEICYGLSSSCSVSGGRTLSSSYGAPSQLTSIDPPSGSPRSFGRRHAKARFYR